MIIVPRYRGQVLVATYVWCLGCKHAHGYTVHPDYYIDSEFYKNRHQPLWKFNGDLTRPTLTPSMRSYYTHPTHHQDITTCHFFVRDGQIEYLSDCQHEYAGKTIPLPDFPLETYELPFQPKPE